MSIPKNRYPQSAQHIEEAIANGVQPSGVINRPEASNQRRQNLRGVKTKKGLDRDEFPPAVVTPTGDVSVKHINPSDNRGAGSYMKNKMKHLPNGTKVCFRVDDQ